MARCALSVCNRRKVIQYHPGGLNRITPGLGMFRGLLSEYSVPYDALHDFLYVVMYDRELLNPALDLFSKNSYDLNLS